MLVTLDVSRLSGWLNADAPCRVEGVLHDVGQGAGKETGGAWGEGCASSLQGKARLGAWHARVRTESMASMFVTLVVLRLSGWLNANACCRVKKDEGVRCPRGQGDGRAAAGRKPGGKGKGTTGHWTHGRRAHKTCPPWL